LLGAPGSTERQVSHPDKQKDDQQLNYGEKPQVPEEVRFPVIEELFDIFGDKDFNRGILCLHFFEFPGQDLVLSGGSKRNIGMDHDGIIGIGDDQRDRGILVADHFNQGDVGLRSNFIAGESFDGLGPQLHFFPFFL